jgi:tetratricopeptide (TPR) repeat protein/mono/diheme cytochrome c family protein
MRLVTRSRSIAFIVTWGAFVQCPRAQSNALPKPREFVQHVSAESATGVTFTQDIAPILYSHCGSCHRPEGSAPFSLLSYSDAREHADKIAEATESRHMPPWKPEPGYGEFTGVRQLTDEQIGLIRRWIVDGAIEGDPSNAPPTPQWRSAWQLGEPDLILTMPTAYRLRETGDDMYRYFVIPIPITERRYVKALELRVNNTHVVHHATMEFDTTGASRLRDERDPEPGYEGLIAHSVMAPDGYFLDWAPGHSPYFAPGDMSFPIEKASDLVLMMHLRPSGKAEMVQATVGLYFSETPPTRVPALLRLTRQDLDIPAGVNAHVVTNSFTLPVAVDVYTVQPHAHNLARQVEGFATLPDGTTTWLLRINDWDFKWQDVYRYVAPVTLPAGTKVVMRWTYDNSTINPRNPNRPPQAVTFGQRTSDEMAELWFQVVPQNQRDRATFVEAQRNAVRLENLKGYEMMLRATPDNPSLRDDAALLYVEAGNFERAATHFGESARLQSASAAAQYNLGAALLKLGRSEEARASFDLALQLDRDYANAYRSLGMILQAEGRLDAAAANYREAIRRTANDAASHHRLGMVLQLQGDFDKGVAEYREALRISGDDVDTLVDLAWALATASTNAQRQPDEALRFAERARKLAQAPTSVLLDVLAAALAAVGRFDEAAATAEQAVSLSRIRGATRDAEVIAARAELYRQRQPYVQHR